MRGKTFQFKQFAIQQNKTAMKVGTDGVLLGAWAKLQQANTILDIGTGTGLIALMCAQRSSALTIDAVELEENAYLQAVENFEQSNWNDRLFCYHASFQQFYEEVEEEYEVIISNPPFYTATYKNLDKKRALARHTQSLPYSNLLLGTSKLLAKNGKAFFIIPFKEERLFLELANRNSLHANKITRVKGSVNSKIKRSLLELSFKETEVFVSQLVIEETRHNYTLAYRNLVKDFYLRI